MSQSRRFDYWAIPNLLLWLILLIAGFLPDKTFEQLREWGDVRMTKAWVNSPSMLILACLAYLAFFTYQRSREAGLDADDAFARALHVTLVALVAFMPASLTIELLLRLRSIPPTYRRFVYFVSVAKTGAWLYLLGLIVRYYFLQREKVFRDMFTFFPLFRQRADKQVAEDGKGKEPELPTDPLATNESSKPPARREP